MTEPTLQKTHELLEKLTNYVMNEVPTKNELQSRLGEVRIEIEKRLQKLEEQLDQKADKKDIQILLEGMDSMAKNLDDMRIEQKAFVSGLKRIEERVEKLEKAAH